ncbi:MAG: AmmeMemoRadiSam system protein B [Kiritimatiellales bacterium]|nr:AmmeMemoRadiSam system protein B [Kiritimatiellales bacterium]
MKADIRQPAVAGMFYPAEPATLRGMIEGFLAAAEPGPHPKAIVVPHAGYVYSGPIAASAYIRIPATVSRVVVLGPSHRVPLRGLAGSAAAFWCTPLGDVPVECPPVVPVNDAAHELEHSLEVQVPFLQVVLDDFTLVPLVAGDASAEAIAEVLEELWGGPETLIVISSDLSHYENYETARAMDEAAAEAILALDERGLDYDNACGLVPICGLLHLAKQKKLRAKLIDLRNSGDTAGPRDQVVGYGAFAFYE